VRDLLIGLRAVGLGLALLGAAGILAGCEPQHQATPLGELNKQQVRGRTTFQAHCAMCHFDRKSGSLQGPSMLGVYRKPSLPSGAAATDERVTATILHGHGLMPPIGSMDQQDVEDVLAYLHTL
jgi:mono/diheme cytochrome c family protein